MSLLYGLFFWRTNRYTKKDFEGIFFKGPTEPKTWIFQSDNLKEPTGPKPCIFKVYQRCFSRTMNSMFKIFSRTSLFKGLTKAWPWFFLKKFIPKIWIFKITISKDQQVHKLLFFFEDDSVFSKMIRLLNGFF